MQYHLNEEFQAVFGGIPDYAEVSTGIIKKGFYTFLRIQGRAVRWRVEIPCPRCGEKCWSIIIETVVEFDALMAYPKAGQIHSQLCSATRLPPEERPKVEQISYRDRVGRVYHNLFGGRPHRPKPGRKYNPYFRGRDDD